MSLSPIQKNHSLKKKLHLMKKAHDGQKKIRQQIIYFRSQ